MKIRLSQGPVYSFSPYFLMGRKGSTYFYRKTHCGLYLVCHFPSKSFFSLTGYTLRPFDVPKSGRITGAWLRRDFPNVMDRTREFYIE